MTEPNSALQQLVSKRQEILGELDQLRVETQRRQELLLRIEGGIEALGLVGATLESAEAGNEGPAPEAD